MLQHWSFLVQVAPGGLWQVPMEFVPTPQQKLLLPPVLQVVDVATQVPAAVHVSPVVQARPSLQLWPTRVGSGTQVPVVLSHFLHWPQTMSGPALHTPSTQKSFLQRSVGSQGVGGVFGTFV